MIGAAGQHIWAVERADRVIGHAWIGERDTPEGGRVAFVYEIEIGEAHRGQGHGRPFGFSFWGQAGPRAQAGSPRESSARRAAVRRLKPALR